MALKDIKLTCDLGEGFNHDAELMPFLNSCSIACGYHAGDMNIMRKAVALAKENNVTIGAHPSYPDKENFGRKKIKMNLPELINAITDQVNTLNFICEESGVTLKHLKPHGALYNMAVTEEETAEAIIEALKALQLNLAIYTSFQGALANLAKLNNIQIINEAFADRNYNDDLTLVQRHDPKAEISDPQKVWEHVKLMHEQKLVKTISGDEIPIKADIFCVHGDNPNALAIARFLHDQFRNK